MNYEDLEKGRFCSIDDDVRSKLEEIKSLDNNNSTLKIISEYISSIGPPKKITGHYFRKRTASQIIKSNEVTGCTDKAILLCTLARCAGYKALMVETFKDADPINSKEGHVFNKIYFNNEWHIYESEGGKKEDYSFGGSNYLPAAIGMDFSSYYKYKDFHDIDVSKTGTFEVKNAKELSMLAQQVNEDRLQKKPSNKASDIAALKVDKEVGVNHGI